MRDDEAFRPRAALRPAPGSDARRTVPAALLDGLSALAAAADPAAVAQAAVQAAVRLTGARAGALGVIERRADSLVFLADVGYDCALMAAGSRLPLDSGLPVTEAARTGAPVVIRVPDGGWVALPVHASGSDGGALLVSLTAGSDVDLDALSLLAADSARALSRCLDRRAGWSVHATRTGDVEVAARRVPLSGAWAGDVVEVVPAADGDGAWVIIADVRGAGAEAAGGAARLAAAASDATLTTERPGALVLAVDAALAAADDLGERFATMAVCRLHRAVVEGVEVTLALAGHPAALLCHDGAVRPVGEPTVPVNLRLTGSPPAPTETTVFLGPADSLLLYTDGLVDRRDGDASALLGTFLAASAAISNPDEAVDVLLRAVEAAAGPARDDTALALLRCAGVPTA